MGLEVWWIFVGGVIWCEMGVQIAGLVGVDVLFAIVVGRKAGWKQLVLASVASIRSAFLS